MATPLKHFYPLGRCQSLNKRGERCGCRIVYFTKKGTARCRFHGGAHYNRIARGIPIVYIGPRTKAGKQRIIAAALRNRPLLMKKLMMTPTWKKHLESNRQA